MKVLAFQQDRGTQLISIVYKKEDFHASEIKNRVINSVELEIRNTNQQKPNKE